MNYWNHIYEHFDPVAFSIGVDVHWYGIMYVLALISALVMAKWIVTKDKLPVDKKVLDDYFIWIEVGVILGARLGYILFYDPNTIYYLTHPWQMFNPFNTNGEFIGIRGMSYHGALIGFLLGSYLFARKHNYSFWFLMDIVAIAVPVGYIFGRIGNFLNQELIGRTTDVPWGIYVDGVLRHPSQLYEAFLEGIVVALIIYFIRHRVSFAGGLTLAYGALYGLARFTAEFWRAPDVQIGYIYGDWMTQGQLLSLPMIIISIIGIYYLKEAQFPRELNRKR